MEIEDQALLARMEPSPFLMRNSDEITLRFEAVSKYRVTDVNDEEYYRGKCRFSSIVPSWGEFYEISGDTRDEQDATPWVAMDGSGTRHFHFYMKDCVLEIKAQSWSML